MHDKMDGIAKLIQAIGVAAWPGFAFYLAWTYRKHITAIVGTARDRKFTIELGGQKLSMEEVTTQQKNLIGDLQAQLLDLRTKVEGSAVSPGSALLAPAVNSPSGHSVLWVDDKPRNNSYFIDILQWRGYRVDLATSTAEGMELASRNAYRLILSDMGRTENGEYKSKSGLVLLEELRRRDSKTPFVIFTSASSVRQYRDQSKELGAQAIASSFLELRAILDEYVPDESV